MTAKNYASTVPVDLKRPKPDPLSDIKHHSQLYMSEKDFRSPVKSASKTPGSHKNFSSPQSDPLKKFASPGSVQSVSTPQQAADKTMQKMAYFFNPDARSDLRRQQLTQNKQEPDSPFKSSVRSRHRR